MKERKGSATVKVEVRGVGWQLGTYGHVASTGLFSARQLQAIL